MLDNIFSSQESKKKAAVILLLIVLVAILMFFIGKQSYSFFANAHNVREYVYSFGMWAPVVFIMLQVLQVLIAPIPGQAVGLASGYIFGVLWGTVYTMIGTTLGSFIAFYLARKFGRPFVEEVIDKKTLKRFDYIAKDKGVFALFLIFLLPALPDDAICFIAGLTKIRIRTLVLITFIGRFPGFLILNIVGNGIAVSQTALSFLIFGVMMVLSFIIYLNRTWLEKKMHKVVLYFRK